MPKTPTTKLVEVPGELDPHHPWLAGDGNRDALMEFLTLHEVDPFTTVWVKFTRDWFEVMVRVRDEHGGYVYTPDGRDIETIVQRHPYKEGSKPRILKGAYPRRVQ